MNVTFKEFVEEAWKIIKMQSKTTTFYLSEQ